MAQDIRQCDHCLYREKQKCLLSNYSSTWLKYKEKWESQPLAIRMKEAKCKADVMEKECKQMFLKF